LKLRESKQERQANRKLPIGIAQIAQPEKTYKSLFGKGLVENESKKKVRVNRTKGISSQVEKIPARPDERPLEPKRVLPEKKHPHGN